MDSVTSSMIGKGMMTSSMIDKASELFRICDQEEKGSFSLSKKFDRQVNYYSKFQKFILLFSHLGYSLIVVYVTEGRLRNRGS